MTLQRWPELTLTDWDDTRATVHMWTQIVGKVRLALEPRMVASFYTATMAALADVGVHVSILARPVEIADAVPFADDTVHHAYDPDAMRRFWLALVHGDRVLKEFRGRFIGKASPVHFFGSPHLCVGSCTVMPPLQR